MSFAAALSRFVPGVSMIPRMRIMTKLSILLTLAAAIIFVVVAIDLVRMKEVMLTERKIAIRQMVETIVSLGGNFNNQVMRGERTLENAQTRLKNIIRSLRYSHDGYFFVYNLDGVTEAHAHYPELEGKYRLDVKDVDGVPYYKNLIDVARDGGGYVTYRYRKPTGPEVFPKVAYAQLFGPWDWVIVTGVYTDDIDAAFYAQMRYWALIISIPFFLLIIVARYLAHTIARPVEQLEKAKDIAEAATRAKSAFLSNMSHEIRTPLNGAMGMIALLLETTMDRQQRAWAEIAYQSVEELTVLIDDIVDLSKIEEGQMVLDKASFDLFNAIEAVVRVLFLQAEKKGLDIYIDIEPDVPRYVIGDSVRFRQIIFNLISNAIKFTNDGFICLAARVEQKGDDVEYFFTVRDTGVGIPEDKQDYIFDTFTQAEESTTREYGGTGLGLALCRRLVKMMGGDIGVHSHPFEGSTFWFSLRMQTDPFKREMPPCACDLSKLRMLYVSHKSMAHELSRKYAGLADMAVVGTESTDDAMRLLKQAVQDKTPYHFIIIDTGMPDEAGQLLVDRLLARPDLRQKAQMLLLVSPDKAIAIEDDQLTESVGILVRPVFPSHLREILMCLRQNALREDKPRVFTRHLRSLTGQERPQDGPLFPLGAGGGEQDRYKVLLVEDQRINQLLMKTVLEKAGCDVFLAENGLEAVDMVKDKPFDLVFMDCNMPKMDGFDATRAIRAFESREGGRVPIVALTADAMKGDREKCLAAGMDDYLNKPIKLPVVLTMIAKHCMKRPLKERD